MSEKAASLPGTPSSPVSLDEDLELSSSSSNDSDDSLEDLFELVVKPNSEGGSNGVQPPSDDGSSSKSPLDIAMEAVEEASSGTRDLPNHFEKVKISQPRGEQELAATSEGTSAGPSKAIKHIPSCGEYEIESFNYHVSHSVQNATKLKAALDNDNEENKKRMKKNKQKPKKLYKSTSAIANHPFVTKYFQDQQRMLTVDRAKYYNLCECESKQDNEGVKPETSTSTPVMTPAIIMEVESALVAKESPVVVETAPKVSVENEYGHKPPSVKTVSPNIHLQFDTIVKEDNEIGKSPVEIEVIPEMKIQKENFHDAPSDSKASSPSNSLRITDLVADKLPNEEVTDSMEIKNGNTCPATTVFPVISFNITEDEELDYECADDVDVSMD